MSYYKQRIAEIKAEKEREFDRVEKRVKTKAAPKPKPLPSPVQKPQKSAPELTKMGELVGWCVTCGAPSVCLIRGFRVCKDPRCKYLAWTF